MQAMERWNDWLEALRGQIGSYQAIAEKLGLHHNTVLNWKVSLPDIKQEIPLATLAGVDVAVLRELIDAARDELTASKMATERARLERRREALGRPQPGTMGSAVVPSPKRAAVAPPSPARRRKRGALGGLILACLIGSGSAEVDPYPWTIGFSPSLLSDLRRKWFSGWRTCPA